MNELVQKIDVKPESSTKTGSITTDGSSTHDIFSTSETSVDINIDLALLCVVMLVLYSARRRH